MPRGNYDQVKRCIERRKAWVNKFKEVPCKRCGVQYPPVAMDFHHRDPSVKSFTVGQGVYRKSKQLVQAEIEKCDVYCSNCHRILESELRRGVTGSSARHGS